MSAESQAAMVLDCVCGHSERDHIWESVAQPGLMRAAQCAWRGPVINPQEYGGEYVLRQMCRCAGYTPDTPLKRGEK